MKKIGIDARFYGSIGKGLGRYTQKLIENLEKIDTENEYYIFLRKENFEEYEPANKRFKKVLADYDWYSFSEQINMPRLLGKYGLDLMHFPHFNVPIFYRGKLVVTIHDLILLHFPTLKGTTLNYFFYWVKFFIYKVVIFLAINRAENILTVSEFTKNDILKNYNVASDKITVTYEACDFKKREEGGDNTEKIKLLAERYGIMKPYVLYVGNAYPHKNLERLLNAFSGLEKEIPDLKLVLVGKKDYFYERLVKLVKEKEIKNVVFTGLVSDKDLKEVYAEADSYVFPSLYEGFGLPPLEAMASGIPVLSSDHACMKEILGESVYFFDASDEDKIREAIGKFFTDKELKKDFVDKGYDRVNLYSWEKMAEKTLRVYQN